jgi:hypothetical protein
MEIKTVEWNGMGTLRKKKCNRSRERHTIEKDDITRGNKGIVGEIKRK